MFAIEPPSVINKDVSVVVTFALGPSEEDQKVLILLTPPGPVFPSYPVSDHGLDRILEMGFSKQMWDSN